MSYFVLSVIWIFFSDRLLQLVTTDSTLLMEMQTYKGWFFVLVTSILLFLLIEKSTSKVVKSRNKIKKALNEKQVVLSELHHRVKNNLSIICGLIEMQIDELDNRDEARALKSIQYRIYSLADIEELFYQNRDMSSVPFHDFLNHLVISLNEPGGAQFRIKKNISDSFLKIDKAVPFGLMVNEIFSQLRMNGNLEELNYITVSLSQSDSGQVTFEIGFDVVPSTILSQLRGEDQIESILLNLFIDQLHADTEWREQDGISKFSVSFDSSDTYENMSLPEMPLANQISN
ncbi:hypothetical protein G3570_05265 [Balneolaceae bacterium YR4-1]|uniref:histidine kinase n=1 Tax=Halalkalibaculum roseum TaxID=2709311 RepID=A0A6M1SVB0_9BACT|nr:histidine kinase dimerization/phosphoacceptor domain -containing protein [Halalkalibaculum roseum]NGP76028.1 hypothetical protein [Halalkalibaculum roseum]